MRITLEGTPEELSRFTGKDDYNEDFDDLVGDFHLFKVTTEKQIKDIKDEAIRFFGPDDKPMSLTEVFDEVYKQVEKRHEKADKKKSK